MARPKGYAEWNPRPETLEVLLQVERILDEYRSYGAMTARQVFYRLVGQYGYDKTEQAYARLCEYLVRARRAELIPFNRIRDDGTTTLGGGGWSDRSRFWDSVRYTAQRYKLDHQNNQPFEIELWCEASGMAPMLASMVADWHIPVYSTGGFSSVTVTYEAAARIAERDRPTIFLHVGDYDPSGESIFLSMAQDIGAFVAEMQGGEYFEDSGVATNGRGDEWFTPKRIALAGWQVEHYQLPTAPPKRSDTRSANWSGTATTQLEAMPPDLLEDVVRSEVESHIDHGVLRDTIRQENIDREEIMRILRIAESEE